MNNNKVKPSEFEVKSSGVSSERQLVAPDGKQLYILYYSNFNWNVWIL